MTQPGFTSIPFKAETGLSKVNGVAKFSNAGIVLDFESKIFGIIPGGAKEVLIAKEEVRDIKFRKGLFKLGAKIVIRLHSFSKLAELPSKDGKLTLKLQRDDFEIGRQVVEQFDKELIREAASLPPTHTPVSVLFDESEDETKELEDR